MTVFTIDDSPESVSRFESRVRGHADSFRFPRTHPTANQAATWFAFGAWNTGLSWTIDQPSYVRRHGRVDDWGLHVDEVDRPAIWLHLAAPNPTSVRASIHGQRWQDRWTRPEDAAHPQWMPPRGNDRPTLVTILLVRVPLPLATLPVPQFDDGIPDMATAREFVRVLVDHTNTTLAPVMYAIENTT